MGQANWLIEEFMLLANKRVAGWVSDRKPTAPPFVYRIHDLPVPKRSSNCGCSRKASATT